MRLIDADALADALYDKRKAYPQWAADTIGSMPDAVVRCKDCKYCVPLGWDDWYGSCRYFNTHSVHADGFCSNGERREEDA